jgi:tetratricopeptide (TPR) repeat protein
MATLGESKEGRPLLESWKEISAYLNRSVKTCQLWEVKLGLPVHRLDGTPCARVFARPEELEAWLAEKLHHAEAAGDRAARTRRGLKRRWIFAPVAAVTLAGAAFLAWREIPRVSLPAAAPAGPSLTILPFEDASNDGSLGLWTTAFPQLISVEFLQSRYASCSSLADNFPRLKKLGLAAATKFSAEDLKNIAPGGEFLVTGSLVRSGKDIIADVVLNDGTTGEPVHTFRSIARGEDELFAAIDELTRRIKIATGMSSRAISQDIDEDVDRITTRSLEALAQYCRGIRLIAEDQATDAVKAFQAAVEIDPGFAEAYYHLFLVTSALANCCDNDWAQKEAVRAGTKAFEHSDRLNIWSREALANYFYLGFQRDIPRAVAEFKRLLGLMKDDPIATLQLAQIYWDLEDYPKVIGLLENPPMKEDPRNVQRLANSYMRIGALDKAEMTWEALRQTKPRSYLYDQELLALARGRFDEASALNDRLRSGVRTLRYSIPYTRVPLLIAGDDFPGAESEFRAVIEHGSPEEQVDGRLHLARLFVIEGRLAEAAEEARATAVQADGLDGVLFNSESHMLRATLLRLSGDPAGALIEAEEACRLCPPDGSFGLRPLHLKGLILLDMGRMDDFEEVAGQVKKFVEEIQYPRLMRAYYHLLGEREMRLGRPDQAIDYFWKALNLLPSPYGHDFDIEASRYYFSLAEGYEQAGRFETALEMYRKVPFTWAQKLDAGDLYARCSYLIGRTYGQSLPQARWARSRLETERAAALESLRRYLNLRGKADPMFAAEVEDARTRIAVLEADLAAGAPGPAK